MALYVPQNFFREAADCYRRAGQRVCDEPLTALAFDDSTIVHGVLALLRAMKDGAPDLYAQATMQWLATHLLSTHRRWRNLDEGGRDPGILRDPRLARVMGYMSAQDVGDRYNLTGLLELAISLSAVRHDRIVPTLAHQSVRMLEEYRH